MNVINFIPCYIIDDGSSLKLTESLAAMARKYTFSCPSLQKRWIQIAKVNEIKKISSYFYAFFPKKTKKYHSRTFLGSFLQNQNNDTSVILTIPKKH